ncbi:MAG: BatD family protein, partial [Spirochaetia bacterium]|nr:BatD family protein [Spirochaetia bacterium]
LSVFSANAENISTELSQKTAAVGETVRLTITVEGAPSGLTAPAPPRVDGLSILFGGSSRSFQYINGKTFKGLSLIYNITALKKGSYSIPPIKLEYDNSSYSSEAVQLIVTEGGLATAGFAAIKGVCEPSAREIFTGEPLLLRYYIYSSGSVEINQIEKMPESAGFIIKQIDEDIASIIVKEGGGELLKEYFCTYVLVPAESGEKQVGACSVIFTTQSGNSFFDMGRQSRLEFDNVRVRVKPLPKEGKPDYFSGNVGSFTMKVSADDGSVKIFDEKKITVAIEGSGNLISPAKPVFISAGGGIKAIIADGKADFKAGKNALTGRIDFEAALIPERSGAVEAGHFRFDFYDTAASAYRSIESEPVRITVTGDADEQETISFDDETGVDLMLPLLCLVVLAVLGGMVFIILKERNRGGEIVPRGGKTETENPEESLKRDTAAARLRHDPSAFSRGVDSIYNRMSADDSFAETEALRIIADVKNEMYALRFGGGNISDEKIDEWFSRLKAAGVL